MRQLTIMMMGVMCCLSLAALAADVDDPRGKMVPWEKGAWETGQYRNILLEAGYKQEDIDAKLAKAYYDLFEGPNRVYFEVGEDMAYVSDLKNRDARTEGLSYGMMVAVQLDKKDIFDRLWRWTVKYMQHQDGPREGYFAWSVNPETGRKNSQGSASDGELFFVTALLFASNRWGNDTGIDYYGEARRILDAMWSKDGTAGVRNIINTEHKMITFVPEGRGYNWTDPSYHVPAFFEIWAEYAKDGHEDFYRECADVARAFLHKACHPVTGLTPDYSEYDGSPLPGRMSEFGFDSWRVPMNIAMDYAWYAKDKEWQQDYGRRLHNFLYAQGVNSFVDQYSLDGSPRERIMLAPGYQSVRHSLGFVSTAATAATMGTQAKSWKFVDGLWNAKLEPYEDGYFDPYYDGFLYLFSLMHLSGNYQIIKPAEAVLNDAAAELQIKSTETASRTVEDGGTGPYKAIMATDSTLDTHTIFRPKDLGVFGQSNKLPIIAWGNGACANSPWEHVNFLSEVASHGFLVIAIGTMPQEGQRADGRRTTSSQLIEAIDWAIAKNSDKTSPYYNKIDTTKISVSGMSCGGLQALEVAHDSRITTAIICNSGILPNPGAGMPGMPSVTKNQLEKLHSAVLYLLGGPSDIAYANGMDDFKRINHVPVYAANLDVGHGGTYRQPHGGEYAVVATAWYQWQLKNDQQAGTMFTGQPCGLSQRSGWVVDKKNLP